MRWTKTMMASIVFFVALSVAANADTLAYMNTGSANFGTIDLNTGAFSLLGTSPVVLAGLGEITSTGSTLYGSSYTSTAGLLYTVNPANGALTQVGAGSGVDYFDFGSTLTSLYSVDTSGVLWSINATTGAATRIGPTGVPVAGFSNLSTNSSTLYLSSNGSLYTLNLTTGAGTLVGSHGGPQIGALILEGSVLYGGEDSPAEAVDTINIGTGAATVGPSLTPTTFGNFFGLAPAATTATPEPGTLWLSFGFLAGVYRIKRSRLFQ